MADVRIKTKNYYHTRCTFCACEHLYPCHCLGEIMYYSELFCSLKTVFEFFPNAI